MKKIFLINLLFVVSFLLLAQAGNVMAKGQDVGRYALIEQSTGKVVNVILLDPSSSWVPPAGHIVIRSDKVGPGDIWDGREFKKAPPKEKELTPPIQADGNDIAELMQAAEDSILPGDMVAVTAQGLTLRKTDKPYDKNIVGVVSLKPGIVLGRAENGLSVPVALTGRVSLKVSAENGPIVPGDAITSSSKPGVGMKATKPGRVVGIALEPYDIEADVAGQVIILINPHWQGGDLSVEQNSSGQLVNIDKEQLRAGLATLGLVVNQDGVLEVGELKAQRIEVQNPFGLTIYDTVTGQPQCVISQNGQLRSVAGKCDGLVAASAEQTQNPSTSFTVSDVELRGAGNTQNNAETTTASEFQPTPEPAPVGSSDPTAPSNDGAEPASTDTTAPVITLLGEATIQLEVGATYTDEGASATDDVDGDLTSSIVTVNPVDTSAQGTYAITYNVSDAAGNAASEVTRTVNVVAPAPPPDITAPVITILGEASVTLEAGAAYADAGATATDDVDGDITASIVTVNPVDTAAPGTYTVTYNVSDAAGNAATPATRTVTVIEPAPEPTP